MANNYVYRVHLNDNKRTVIDVSYDLKISVGIDWVSFSKEGTRATVEYGFVNRNILYIEYKVEI